MYKGKYPKIPEATIKRLSIYLRCLRKLEEEGNIVVSSQNLADICCVNSTQIRKDLSYFGEFGTRGVGYNIKTLQEDIKKILGLDTTWNMILIGYGNLGRALLHYRGFFESGYRWVGIFDTDKDLIGTKIDENLEVEDFNQLNDKKIKEIAPDFAVITTPPEVAQDVVNKLILLGMKYFLNFAPTKIKVPDNVLLKNVFIIAEFDNLVYNISKIENK